MRLIPRPSTRSPLAALRAASLALLIALPLAGCMANGAGDRGAGSGGATDPALATGTAPPPPDTVASGATPPATDATGKPLIAQPAGDAGPAPAGSAPGTVDDACTTDADCAVKNVGSCCGYYPACVNKDSPTFPEQVQAECAKNDLMSVCGFRDITGCQCVDGRCAALGDGEGPVR